MHRMPHYPLLDLRASGMAPDSTPWLFPVLVTAGLWAGLTPFAATAAPDPMRLDDAVVPTQQALELHLDARAADYTGLATIDLKVQRPVTQFRFHARELELQKVALKDQKGIIPTTFVEGDGDLVTVTAGRTLSPGAYSLEVAFHNDLSTHAIGLYKVGKGEESYTFSQFEAMFAREAFPCWDEPSFKIPWQITLEVPQQHEAITNTPVENPGTVLKAQKPGWKRLKFLKSKPMSSYLLAFATGPLESAPIPGMSIPARVVTVKGKLPLAQEAIRVTPDLLKALEKWFDRRYPYEKLDIIAAPEFMYGAMENPGAIVFKESVLLMDAATAPQDHKLYMYLTVTHELAHMWFGDLVTMRWWNDLWLNESFASWMATKIVTQVHPQFNLPVHSVDTGLRAMHQDARLSSRAIRREVAASQDALGGIGLHYSKGEAMLGMFEQWLGAETFRKGVLAHLEAHAWGNADAAELFAAFEKAGGKSVVKPMTTFVENAGVPLVRLEPLGANQIRLTQERLLAIGQKAASTPLWQIPIRLRYFDGKKVSSQSFLMTEASQVVTLQTSTRPAWIHLNDGEVGYYRWWVPSDMMKALVNPGEGAGSATSAGLSVRERVALLDNLVALFDSGILPADDYLLAIETFLKDEDPTVLARATRTFEGIYHGFVRGQPALDAPFAAMVQRSLTPVLKKLGNTPAKGETQEVSALRAQLMGLLGVYGKDNAVLATATQQADGWLKDPNSLDASLVEVAVALSAHKGDKARYELYVSRFEQTDDPFERGLLLGTLGQFRDPVLADRAREYALSGPLRPHELMSVYFGQAERADSQQQALEYVIKHYDEIASRIAPEFRVHLPWLSFSCDEAQFQKTKGFFLDPARQAPGMSRIVAEAEEGSHACAMLREREGAAVARYLGK